VTQPDPSDFSVHQVGTGRIFARHTREATIVIGVVELPATWELDTLRPARLASRLWLDTREPAALQSRSAHTRECDLGGMLKMPIWRRPADASSLDMLARATAIAHESHDRVWAAVAGLARPDLPSTPKDGLYEIQPAGMQLIDDNPHAGETIGGIFKQCIWGPEGAWGLAHTMRLDEYAPFIEASRQQNRNPAFLAYFEAMRQAGAALPGAYTRNELARIEAKAQDIIHRIYVDERLAEMQGLANALQVAAPRGERARA